MVPPSWHRGGPFRCERIPSFFSDFFDNILDLSERDIVALAECEEDLARLLIDFEPKLPPRTDCDEAVSSNPHVAHPVLGHRA